MEIKDLLELVREIRSDHNTRINDNVRAGQKLSKRLHNQIKRIDELEIRLSKLEVITENLLFNKGNEPVEIPSGIPPSVCDLATLKQFVDATFPHDVRKYQKESMRMVTYKIRDSLAKTYTNIKRINDLTDEYGYSAPDHKHSDAFYIEFAGESMIIDFCVGSSDPGVVYDNLMWSVEPVSSDPDHWLKKVKS